MVKTETSQSGRAGKWKMRSQRALKRIPRGGARRGGAGALRHARSVIARRLLLGHEAVAERRIEPSSA